MSKATIIWKSIGTGLVACLLIGAVVWGYRMAPTDEPCVSLEINISDQDERMYLSETELTGLLQTADLYPVGRKQDLVSLHRIEQAIRQHPMVRTAECYMTPRREVKIKLTQRVPLLLVSKADELYFIDTDRRVMPFRERVKDKVLKVTGTVSKQAAATQLADFALWLQDNSYWRNRIACVQVVKPNSHILYLRGENMPCIVMGPMFGYERKLKKLRIFLDNMPQDVQDKHYQELDIRFRGQVIGRQ